MTTPYFPFHEVATADKDPDRQTPYQQPRPHTPRIWTGGRIQLVLPSARARERQTQRETERQRLRHTETKSRETDRPTGRQGQTDRELLLVDCLTSQQQASVSQGRICTDNFTCGHTETEVADQTFHLIQSQYTDTGPTSPSADPITPGVWQGSHWSANV